MYSMEETLIVLVVVPALVAGAAIGVAKEVWEISGWETVGVGIGGWFLGLFLRRFYPRCFMHYSNHQNRAKRTPNKSLNRRPRIQ